ncbi:Aste57867_15207 [Aphanomyces stellatus]|uniref:Aste57867_15207 protein n=1 Tax=Aphanomyces stellatus TaxID=120398 RepID=A0A485L2V9_9STRA|nr:hypothetical protein As57867_015151 [Aphanomyces stellatus]VFT92016.1 Aste57867_15207 [Aphanomyces stellatus]
MPTTHKAPPSRRHTIDPLPWYRNTFDREGIAVDPASGALSYTASHRTDDDDSSHVHKPVDQQTYQPSVPRQHAAAWTRRQEKLEPIATRPVIPHTPSKLLGRMSWDPHVLDIRETERRPDSPTIPRDKLRTIPGHAKAGGNTHATADDGRSPMELLWTADDALTKMRANTAVQALRKRDEDKYLEPVEREFTFTSVGRARQSLLGRFSFHDSMMNVATEAIDRTQPNDAAASDERVVLSNQRSGSQRNKAASLTPANQLKYFGGAAKQTFYAHYKAVSGKHHLFRATPTKYRVPPSSGKRGTGDDNDDDEDDRIGDDEAMMLRDVTPRTRAVVSSLSSQRPAIPLIIRKDTTSVFDFSYQSLGDVYVAQFAACAASLPFVEEINVRDNRLSDAGLNTLLVAIHKHLKLRRLDISENEIGTSAAKTLRRYIEDKACTLKQLVMEKSDIDDFECAAFMTAFEKNTSVVELVIPRNRIGEAEQLNVVKPEITTGGEAIASMLYVNETISMLDMSWNLLRLESGVTLAQSLQFNKKLLELHVAYNACGDAGAMTFGHVLTINATLKVLDLSYNNVGCRGALVLASAASKSKSLRRLLLNGNNIGKEGGRALMFATCANTADQGCEIEITGCNLASTHTSRGGGDKFFDPTDPAGDYSLEMTDPFDRMIATELLRLATFKKGCRFEKLKHHSRTERVKNKGTVVQLVHPNVSSVFNSPLDVFYASVVAKPRKPPPTELTQVVDVFALLSVFKDLHLSPSKETLDAILARMQTEWTLSMDVTEFSDLFLHALFELTDRDGSGGIDAPELQATMARLGLDVTDHEALRAVAQYDLDNSGTIEDFEFVEFMKAQVRYQAFGSKKSMAGLDPNRFALRDVATNQVWQIPVEGRLEVTFVYEREAILDAHDAKNRISDAGIAQLIRNIHLQAKNPTEKLELYYFAIADSEVGRSLSRERTMTTTQSRILFSAAQAYELLEQCGGLTKDVRVKAVGRTLFQMITAKDAHHLVSTTLNLRERAMLKVDLGNAYAVIMGGAMAHFALDLTNKADRWVARKLAETAQVEKKASIASLRGDTSQHMNWENFRNETLDGERLVLTTSFFNSLPQTGRLEFDYVSTSRPPRGAKALSTRRFEQLVAELAKDVVFIDIPDAADATVPEDARARARRRWKKIADYVLQNQFLNMLIFARSHIFRIKNCREEVRLKLVQIETVVSDRYLTAAQASQIVMSMPSGFHGRVEAARVLFARLVDVGNFCDIFDCLARDEQLDLVKMIGWLNIFNPDKPDRFYELDLSVLEDYNMAKILIRLAVLEEGDNWLDGYTYSPSLTEPPHPNWVLPISWDADDTGKGEGPRRTGILRLTFTSKIEDGCLPDWDARQEMKKRVLCGP